MELYTTEHIVGTYEGVDYDHDHYIFHHRSPLASKEYTVVIDFKTNEIFGDMIAYGGVSELEYEECVELLSLVTDPIRDFSHLLK